MDLQLREFYIGELAVNKYPWEAPTVSEIIVRISRALINAINVIS